MSGPRRRELLESDPTWTLGPWGELDRLLTHAEKNARKIFTRETGMDWEPCLGYILAGDGARCSKLRLPMLRVVDRPPSRSAMLAHNALGRIDSLRGDPPKTQLDAALRLIHFRAGRDLAKAGLLPALRSWAKVRAGEQAGGKARRGKYKANPDSVRRNVERLSASQYLKIPDVIRLTAKAFGLSTKTVKTYLKLPWKKT